MSSLTIAAPGPGVDVPVLALFPAALMWDIWLPVSEAPTASMTMTVGSWARKRSLMVELRAAQLDTMSNIATVSWGSPRSATISSSQTRGRAQDQQKLSSMYSCMQGADRECARSG